jgi:hypothetical protein
MAIFTRRAGDANGVNNFDSGRGFLGNIVATGLTKSPTAIKVTLANSQTFAATDLATGGAVETILRAIGQDSTIVMYQADTDRLSVLLEATGSTTAELQTRIRSLGNVGTTSNIFAGPGVTVSSTNGFKLA